MDFNNFMEMIKDNMQFIVGDAAKVEIKEISKNNGRIYHGITVIEKDTNCSPSLYLDDMFAEYCKGMSIEDIMERLRTLYFKSKCEGNIDVSFFEDYDKVCDRVMFKLIGYEKNKKMLENMPFRTITDLAVVYFCEVSDPRIGTGVIMIRNEHIAHWNIDEERLYQDALLNTPRLNPVSINSLMDTVAELSGISDLEDEDDFGMMVLSNQNKMFGASAILYPDILQEVADRFECDLIIIPSSVHEVILMPNRHEMGDLELHNLKNIVECVNRESVGLEDILSDNVYRYDRFNGRCELALS